MNGRNDARCLLFAAFAVFWGGCTAEIPSPTTHPQTLKSYGDSFVLSEEDSRLMRDADGYLSQTPAWSRQIQSRFGDDRVPVLVSPRRSPEEAKQAIDAAMEEAVVNYLRDWFPKGRVARAIAPPVGELRSYLIADRSESIKLPSGEYQEARMLEIPYLTRIAWIAKYRLQRQQIAIQQTLVVAGAILALVALGALYAKLNHATHGKRSGILRAASMVAILFLLGGFMTMAVLSGVFSA